MSLRDEIVRRSKENTANQARMLREAQRYADPSRPENRYRMYMEDFRANQLADAENKRKLEEQKLKNIGAVDVARTTGEGYAERQRLENIGRRDVAGMEQRGLTDRTNITERLAREKAADDRFKMLSELEGTVNMGRKEPIDIWQTYGGYQESPMARLGQDGQRKYNPMEVYDKSGKNLLRTDYFDSTGNIAYSEPVKTTTPNVIGSALPGAGGQSPLSKPSTEITNQKETFESIYGSKPTLKDIWAENERRKKQKEAERKKLWSVPY